MFLIAVIPNVVSVMGRLNSKYAGIGNLILPVLCFAGASFLGWELQILATLILYG